jgi:hypothetical protein
MKRQYGESTVFAVPLGGDAFALGVVARRAPRGRILYGFFFGPKLCSIPKLAELPPLRSSEAVYHTIFGDLGLHNGTWPIIGNLQRWKREDWGMPVFYRRDAFSNQLYEVQYSDLDPAKLLSERPVSDIPGQATNDGLAGAGFVEEKLRLLLN